MMTSLNLAIGGVVLAGASLMMPVGVAKIAVLGVSMGVYISSIYVRYREVTNDRAK